MHELWPKSESCQEDSSDLFQECEEPNLGVPLIHGRGVNRETFESILTKIDIHMSSWKRINLTFVGRVTLTKFVCFVWITHVYYIYYANITYEDISLSSYVIWLIKKCHGFIWSDVPNRSKMHIGNVGVFMYSKRIWLFETSVY